jgi:SAM-dependent methyltransferase
MFMSVFNQYSAYYDLLYQDKDYRAEADYVARKIREAAPTAATMLELGSGTGGHGRLLADMGFDIHGVELSAEMVELAGQAGSDSASAAPPRTNGGRFTCEVGDVRSVRISRRFDAVAALFHVVSYQTSNMDVLATFATAAAHLDPGGVFLFDVWHGPAVVSQKPEARVKRIENSDLKIIRIAEPFWEPEANRITVGYTILATDKVSGHTSEFTEQHPMRYYFPLEIDLLAQATGFKVESYEEWLSGHRPSPATWGIVYLLRKF